MGMFKAIKDAWDAHSVAGANAAKAIAKFGDAMKPTFDLALPHPEVYLRCPYCDDWRAITSATEDHATQTMRFAALCHGRLGTLVVHAGALAQAHSTSGPFHLGDMFIEPPQLVAADSKTPMQMPFVGVVGSVSAVASFSPSFIPFEVAFDGISSGGLSAPGPSKTLVKPVTTMVGAPPLAPEPSPLASTKPRRISFKKET